MLDSMAIGCPMVVSDCPPVNEFMTDGETGLSVGLHDHETLADRLGEALNRRDDMKAMGLAAREVVKTRCDAKMVYPTKDRMLRDLLK